jgi:NAD(P)-dependent dehydrogenase (short-subunit alcohol dehydrogenase family)
MKLKGASVVITGAAHGLGASLSRELVKRGAQVVLSDLESADLQDLGVELDMPTMHCNVTDRDQVEALGRAAVEEFGKIDLWINNAGIWMPYTPSQNIDFNHSHRLMEVNYFGLAFGTLEAAKHMSPRDSGAIINILSVRALKGKALAASYCASKFAAEGFTQSARDELKDSGISVISIYPYRIKTGLFGENRHEDYEQSMEPADVARIIIDGLEEDAVSEHVEIWSKDDVRRR